MTARVWARNHKGILYRTKPHSCLVWKMTCWFPSLTCALPHSFESLNQICLLLYSMDWPLCTLYLKVPVESVSVLFMPLMEPVGLNRWRLWGINGRICSDCFNSAVVEWFLLVLQVLQTTSGSLWAEKD